MQREKMGVVSSTHERRLPFNWNGATASFTIHEGLWQRQKKTQRPFTRTCIKAKVNKISYGITAPSGSSLKSPPTALDLDLLRPYRSQSIRPAPMIFPLVPILVVRIKHYLSLNPHHASSQI